MAESNPNINSLSIMAMAMNAKFAEIKADITSDVDFNRTLSSTWKSAEGSKLAAWEADCNVTRASNNTANTAALAAAEASVDAAADLVVEDVDAQINSIKEAEQEMLANKAAADQFKTNALAEMLSLRTAASDKLGNLNEFQTSINTYNGGSNIISLSTSITEPSWWASSVTGISSFGNDSFQRVMLNTGANDDFNDRNNLAGKSGFEKHLVEHGYSQGTTTKLAQWVDFVRFGTLPAGITTGLGVISDLWLNELGGSSIDFNNSGIGVYIGQNFKDQYDLYNYGGASSPTAGWSWDTWSNPSAHP